MKLLGLIFLAFLTACATPYQPHGTSGGFSETQLDQNVFQVTFKGNAYISREQVNDYTLLRSAEVTLENGFSYFVIVDKDQYVTQSSYTTPSTTYGTATIYGNSVYGSATTYGGQTFYYSKPTSSNLIVCFSERPEGAFSLDARFLKNQLQSKYKLGDYASAGSSATLNKADSLVGTISGTYIAKITGDISALNIPNRNPVVRLTQNGNEISGTFGRNGGLIWGKFDSDEIVFNFQSSGGNEGRGVWKVDPGGKVLTGKWSATWKGVGEWNLTKTDI